MTDYQRRRRPTVAPVSLVLTALSLGACTPPEPPTEPDAPRPLMVIAGQLQSEEIVEASGLARSQLDDSVLWTMNDGGSKPRLYALSLEGAHRGRIKLEEAKNRDWEDLSSFRIGVQAYLLVADTGDNDSKRDSVQLYIVPEPDLDLDDKVRMEPAWTVSFEYPEGPRDAEAVTVDAANQRVLVLTKRTWPPELYEVPLTPGDGKATATLLGLIESLPAPTRNDRQNASFTKDWHWQPTGMDLSPDGKLAVILTYRAIYVYLLDPTRGLFDNLNGTAYALGLGNFPGAESVVFSADSQSMFVTLEGQRAPLIRIDINGALPE